MYILVNFIFSFLLLVLIASPFSILIILFMYKSAFIWPIIHPPVNTLGVIRVTQAFKSLIKLQRDSRIIFMVAGFGRVAFPALGPYTVSELPQTKKLFNDNLGLQIRPRRLCRHCPVRCQFSSFLSLTDLSNLGPSWFCLASKCPSLSLVSPPCFFWIYFPLIGFYPTPMTDRDRASSVLKNLWARLPDTTKQSYGKAFYEFCSLFCAFCTNSFL